MFGCYRRTEAADPATYVSAIALVLTHYSAEVVTKITDPFVGLASRKNENGYSGLPDVADVKQACEEEAAHLARMAKYREMGRTEFKRLPQPPARPGDWANVLVARTAPQYAKLVDTNRSGAPRFRPIGVDPRLWRWDEEGRGIWVALSLIEDRPADGLQQFKPYTDDELRRMYVNPEPASEAMA